MKTNAQTLNEVVLNEEHATPLKLPVVMVVDDDPINRKLVKTWLVGKAAKIESFQSAEVALEKFDKINPDIVISDIHMDGMNGLELAILLKEKYPRLPVVLMTATGQQKELLRAINAGIDHFLLKPIDRTALVAYVEKLNSALNTRAQLKAAREEIIAKNKLLEHVRKVEQETGAGVQNLILYRSPPTELSGTRCAHVVVPAQTVNGDFLDHFIWDAYCYDVLIGDAMGKGLAAALLAAGVKTGLMRVLSQALLDRQKHDNSQALSLENIMTQLRAESHAALCQLESFVTMLYARIDVAQARVTWIDCGHSKIILQRAHQQQCMLLSGQNTPLGMSSDETYMTCNMPLLPGDKLFLLSDGVTELCDSTGKELGFQAVVKLLQKTRSLPIAEAVHQLHLDTTGLDLMHSAAQDDKTILGIAMSTLSQIHPFACYCFQAKLELLPHLREWLSVHSQRLLSATVPAVASTWYEALVLGASECIANILRHGMFSHSKTIELNLIHDDEFLHLEIVYQGKHFDRHRHAGQLPTDLSESSYGLFLIDSLFDEVHYHHDEGGNQTTLLRKRVKPVDATLATSMH